ncbi:Serine/threonine-protein kinase EDR1 [Camellia lanceoleosa]|uniref:Serine/threonine-protein kinase EDR1 n=1 Tax=Camellia lanceoleosa TaxID=1840588 RepID=A0ACC0HNI1_9ERIC|nr:Serine/threonine-protein kinase EDR1 [Camellia lanceoleosa]
MYAIRCSTPEVMLYPVSLQKNEKYTCSRTLPNAHLMLHHRIPPAYAIRCSTLKGVAVKVFSKQEYSDDLIYSFRKEVSLMKRFRHPNVLLFMGAVTSPQRLCIVTEFLPRACIYGSSGPDEISVNPTQL